ncbi:hypothetical protein KUTeg_007177 [Tegillarca granosa]|uniref:Protein kinase domain-containing protein n=1 Tax=Tegillarca granosa TaxID=220873 RepID=A0ABQ9FGN3_TEGGR|nr:hypothetical protein KUTeg_007177 [Tegillarca granosa]
MSGVSLAGLRSKLDRLQARDDTSADVTDNKTWMNTWVEKIQRHGNQPEDWLEYTQYMRDKHIYGCKDSITRHNFLCDIYEKAFEEISQEDNRKNQAYARLFVEYALIKKQFLPDEAKRILSHARAVVRRFSIVHVASAELELEEGNTGESSIPVPLSDERTANTTSDVSRVRQKSCESDTENMDIKTAEITDSTFDKLSNLKAKLSNSCKPGMRSYHSTPEVRDVKAGVDPASTAGWKRKTNFMALGAPLRVKKLNLPFKENEDKYDEMEENMDDNDTLASFKPLEPQANSTMFSTSMAHSSGYLSMAETTIPLVPEKSVFNVLDNQITQPFHEYNSEKPQISSPDIHMEVKHRDKSDQNRNKNQTYLVPGHRAPSPILRYSSKESQPSFLQSTTKAPPPPVVQPSSQFSLPTPIQAQQPISSLTHHQQESVPQQQQPVPVANVLPTPNSKHGSLAFCTPATKGNIPPVPCTPNVPQMEVLEVNGQQYAVLKLIGRGGSSKVYKVFDSALKTKAIKVVKLDDADEQTVNGYKNEISIIHSDLKPSNFILVGGILKLIDFGIAKSIQNDKTSVLTDTQVGTLNYMSPETITDTCGDLGGGSERGRPVYKIGTASDVWSLGCILYNMVYGCTPFQKYVKQFAKLRAIVDPSIPIQFNDIPDKHLMDSLKKLMKIPT